MRGWALPAASPLGVVLQEGNLIAAICARFTCIKPFPQLHGGEANVTRPEGHNHPAKELECPGKSTALLSSEPEQMPAEVPSRKRANLLLKYVPGPSLQLGNNTQ